MIRLAMGYRSSSGRCAPSRHPAEDHPQVLIIALITHEIRRDTKASTPPSIEIVRPGPNPGRSIAATP
jgi:hypothetical protein